MGAPAVEMTDVYMPNQSLLIGPLAKYKLLPQSVTYYIQMRSTIRQIFNNLGYGSKTDPPSVASVIQVPQVPASSMGLFSNYAKVASTLQATYESLQEADTAIAKVAQASATISAQCQADINTAIESLNQDASTVSPDPTVSQNEYTWDYINTSISAAESLLTQAKAAQDNAAGGASDPTTTATKAGDSSQTSADQAAANDLAAQEAADAAAGSGSGISTGATTDYSSLFPSSSTDGAYTGTGSGGSGIANSYGSSYGAGDSGIADELQNAIDSLQNSANDSGDSSGSDMSSLMDSMMLPMMMDQMNSRNNNDSDLDALRNQGASGSAALPAPPPVSQSPASVQATQQPVAPTPPAAPSSTSSTQPTGTPPGQNSDGSVTYTFKDGRTVQTSAKGAKVLAAAEADVDGTDALAAYTKAGVNAPDSKHIGDPIDPSQAQPGDAAIWNGGSGAGGDRTAIIVPFPPDQANANGSLAVIVQGKLQPFTPQISDKQGDFGDFAGFAHPHDIEMSAPSGASTGITTPVSGDPTGASADPTGGATAAPAVAAPTG